MTDWSEAIASGKINMSPPGVDPEGLDEQQVQALRLAYEGLERTVEALITYLGDAKGLAWPLVSVMNDKVEPAISDVLITTSERKRQGERLAAMAEEARGLQQEVDRLTAEVESARERPGNTFRMLTTLRSAFSDADLGDAVDALTVALSHLGYTMPLGVSDSSPVAKALREAEKREEALG